MKVAAVNTSYTSAADFARDVYAASRRQGLADMPTRLLVAHMALSSGWGRSLWNYSLTGIKAGSACVCSGTCSPTYSGSYVCLKGFEYVNGSRVDAVMPFRAYASLDEGVQATLALLRSSRYERSLAYLLAGDTRYFAQLGADGWYTASPSEVSAGCMKNLKQLETYLGAAPAPGRSPILLAGLALAGYGLYRRYRS